MSDKIINISLIGQSNVGKSSILDYFKYRRFNLNINTTHGVDMHISETLVNNDKYTVILHDTAGHERYGAITRMYIKNSHAFIVVYDVTDSESFEKLEYWINEIKCNCNADNEPYIYIVGNKIDKLLQRTVPYYEADKYAQNLCDQIPYTEVSAKSGINIDTLIHSIIDKCIANGKYKKSNETVKVTEQNKTNYQDKQKSCCR